MLAPFHLQFYSTFVLIILIIKFFAIDLPLHFSEVLWLCAGFQCLNKLGREGHRHNISSILPLITIQYRSYGSPKEGEEVWSRVYQRSAGTCHEVWQIYAGI